MSIKKMFYYITVIILLLVIFRVMIRDAILEIPWIMLIESFIYNFRWGLNTIIGPFCYLADIDPPAFYQEEFEFHPNIIAPVGFILGVGVSSAFFVLCLFFVIWVNSKLYYKLFPNER